VGLGRVLEHREPVLGCDRQDRIHVRRVAVEVDRQDQLRARRDRRLELRGVHRERGRLHVDEHGAGAVQQDRLAGGDEGVRDGYHLVAGPMP
jgi:hypothetical protein